MNFPWDRAASVIMRHEAFIDHFYLDSVGVVTIAIGRAVETADEAVMLNKGPLPFSIFHQCASNDTVRNEWEIVADMAETHTGYKADFFKQHSGVRCDQKDAINLLHEDIRERLERVTPHFDNFGDLPDAAKIVIAGLAYNTGSHNWEKRWPKFTKAVNNKDWKEAARQSHRKGISDERNEETHKLILEN